MCIWLSSLKFLYSLLTTLPVPYHILMAWNSVRRWGALKNIDGRKEGSKGGREEERKGRRTEGERKGERKEGAREGGREGRNAVLPGALSPLPADLQSL